MKFRENPIFGRKVFFVNPPFVVEKKLSEWLKDQEYEVYLIKDYRDAKSVLRYYEHAMCFIFIDDGLSLRGWFNFIKSFEEEELLKSIYIGIMAHKTPEASVQKFIMNLKLPGGYVNLGEEPEVALKQLEGILELNGAKGERKFLSLTCNNLEALTGYIAYGSKLYSMSFENISSIGITCSLPPDLAGMLKKGTILNNVALSLGRWSVITECVVLSVNTMGDKIIAVLLFSLNTPAEVKSSIRRFIYDVLNKHLDTILKQSVQDKFNYSAGSPAAEGAIPDFNAPTEDEKAGDAEPAAEGEKKEEPKAEEAAEPVEEVEEVEEAEEIKEEAPAPAAETEAAPAEDAKPAEADDTGEK